MQNIIEPHPQMDTVETDWIKVVSKFHMNLRAKHSENLPQSGSLKIKYTFRLRRR